jgi:hypothetical protein
MPVTYTDVPEGIGIEEKRKLVKGLYDALHEAYPFPDDVRIFVREWPRGPFSRCMFHRALTSMPSAR